MSRGRHYEQHIKKSSNLNSHGLKSSFQNAAGCDELTLKRDTLSASDKHSNYGGLKIPSAHYSHNEHGKLEQMCSGTGFFQCVGEYSSILSQR